MEHRLSLHVDDAGVLRGVADLEHPAGPILDRDPEVLIALADQWGGRAGDAEGGCGDLGGVMCAERRDRSDERILERGVTPDIHVHLFHGSLLEAGPPGPQCRLLTMDRLGAGRPA